MSRILPLPLILATCSCGSLDTDHEVRHTSRIEVTFPLCEEMTTEQRKMKCIKAMTNWTIGVTDAEDLEVLKDLEILEEKPDV
jgi:hypothetical protein